MGLIYSNTHKFIDAALVERRKLQDETFDGFIVIIPGNNSMDCTKWIPKLQITLGNHTITGNVYVVNVAEIVFGSTVAVLFGGA